jgi:hypothetical protein
MEAAGADNSNWNVPAALLESLMLAMAHCVDNSTESIRAYQVVVRLGASLTVAPSSMAQRKLVDPLVWWDAPTGAPQDRGGILDSWFKFGGQSKEFNSPINSLAEAQNAEERRERAIAWLNTVRERMVTLTKNGVGKVNFEEVNREFEIATFLTLAIDSVLSELNRSDLGFYLEVNDMPPSISPEQDSPKEIPPEVEG